MLSTLATWFARFGQTGFRQKNLATLSAVVCRYVRSYFLHEVWLAGYRTSSPYPMEVARRAYTYV